MKKNRVNASCDPSLLDCDLEASDSLLTHINFLAMCHSPAVFPGLDEGVP